MSSLPQTRNTSRWERVMQGNYGTPSVLFVKGKGSTLVDRDGKKYIDFLGGIATNALGHAHPAIVNAVTRQIKAHSHISNFYMHDGGVALAEKLQKLVEDKSARTFFCNSGAEANEAAIKIARLTGRKRIISTIGGFHGRTMGALALTGQPKKQKPFKPLMPGVKFVPYGDLSAMRKVVSRKVSMVIVEPIQGENGVIVPPPGYLEGLRALCDAFGVLLCIDAVQTGMGRTGEWFGFEHAGIQPDIITLAKGLGGGLPLGAMITRGENVPHFSAGDHGSTFGGNPIATAAALATIETIQSEKLLLRAKVFEREVRASLSGVDLVRGVRGRGFLLGVVLQSPVAQRIASLALERGLLINAPQPDVIRFAPPLVISDKEIAEGLRSFKELCLEVLGDSSSKSPNQESGPRWGKR